MPLLCGVSVAQSHSKINLTKSHRIVPVAFGLRYIRRLRGRGWIWRGGFNRHGRCVNFRRWGTAITAPHNITSRGRRTVVRLTASPTSRKRDERGQSSNESNRRKDFCLQRDLNFLGVRQCADVTPTRVDETIAVHHRRYAALHLYPHGTQSLKVSLSNPNKLAASYHICFDLGTWDRVQSEFIL